MSIRISKKKLVSLAFLIQGGFLYCQQWTNDQQYIQKFALYAVEEMEKYKIPASITLAQGIIETGGGQSHLAQEGKNHFGIKCKENWTGKTLLHSDDLPNECFRVYDNVKDSYEDHSLFLTNRPYYQSLFKLPLTDYKAWSNGLKTCGYATHPKYAAMLIKKIEDLKLYEFDTASSSSINSLLLEKYPELKNDPTFIAKVEEDKVSKNGKGKSSISIATNFKSQNTVAKIPELTRNTAAQSRYDVLNSIIVRNHPNGGIKYFISPGELDIELIANKYKIPSTSLMKINEITSPILHENQIVFLENKKNKATADSYTVEAGDSMYAIAQKFGIKVSKIYQKNKIYPGQEPAAGTVLILQ